MTAPGDTGGGGAVESLWRRFQPLVAERLATVERHLHGRGDREAARSAAHALAGALGSYGRAEGSVLAKQLEDAIVATPPGAPATPRMHELASRLRETVLDEPDPAHA